MATSATKAKQKYNEKNYKKITLTLLPNLAEDFKDNATKNNFSQPQFLHEILNFWINHKQILDEKDNEIENQKNRIVQLESIQKNYENLYDNLQKEKAKLENSELTARNEIEKLKNRQTKILIFMSIIVFLVGFIFGKF